MKYRNNFPNSPGSQIVDFFFLYELSRGTISVLQSFWQSLDLLICSRWFWVREFLQDAAHFNLYRLDIKEEIFRFCFVWGSWVFRISNEICCEVMGIRVAEESWFSTMFEMAAYMRTCSLSALSLYLWKSPPGQKSIQKSNIANFSKCFCWFVFFIPKESSLSWRVS